jgi:hypothetical protein
MSFRMQVKVERVLEEGTYVATLANVEKKETKFGERLMWTFDIPEENTEVVGFTSTSYSTKANAYSWAKAIMGEIDPKIGWGPEDVIGSECVVVLEVAEDAQGFEKNKVVKVKPPKKPKAQTKGDEGPDEPNPNLESSSL